MSADNNIDYTTQGMACNFDTAMIVDFPDLNRISDAALGNLAQQLIVMYAKTGTGKFSSGVYGLASYRPTLIAGAVTVEAGVALKAAAALNGEDYGTDAARLMIHPATVNEPLEPEPASYPRVDVLYAIPTETLDATETRAKVIDPIPTYTTDPVNTRKRRLATLVWATGTAGSEVIPAIPLNSVRIGHVTHQSAVTKVLDDTRHLLQLDASQVPVQVDTLAEPGFVVVGYEEEAAASASLLDVTVQAGTTVGESGQMIRHWKETVTVGSGPGNVWTRILADRWNGIVVEVGGSVRDSSHPGDSRVLLWNALVPGGGSAVSILRDERRLGRCIHPDTLIPVEAPNTRAIFWKQNGAITTLLDDRTIPGKLVYADGSNYVSPPGKTLGLRAVLKYKFATNTGGTGGNFSWNHLANYNEDFPAGGYSINVPGGMQGVPESYFAKAYAEGLNGVTEADIVIKDLNNAATPGGALVSFIVEVEVLHDADDTGDLVLASPISRLEFAR